MICNSCRRTLLARLSGIHKASSNHIRTVATVPSTPNAAPSTPPQPTTNTDTNSSPATSSATPGKSQAFSEPYFPSTVSANTKPAPLPGTIVSSIAGGTAFESLSYKKPSNTSKPIVALEDHEYPSWLWTLVADPNAPKENLDGGVDVSTMTARSRAKYERKQAKLMAGLEKPIPIHEQSKDLTGPGDDAVTSHNARAELTKSMRSARRKEIRESNFLKSM